MLKCSKLGDGKNFQMTSVSVSFFIKMTSSKHCLFFLLFLYHVFSLLIRVLSRAWKVNIVINCLMTVLNVWIRTTTASFNLFMPSDCWMNLGKKSLKKPSEIVFVMPILELMWIFYIFFAIYFFFLASRRRWRYYEWSPEYLRRS